MTREDARMAYMRHAHGVYACNECDWTGNVPAMVEHRRARSAQQEAFSASRGRRSERVYDSTCCYHSVRITNARGTCNRK